MPIPTASIDNNVKLTIGYVVFPVPLFGYGVVVGYYVFRIVRWLLSAYGISTWVTVTMHECVRNACVYAYGPYKADLLLEKQVNGTESTILIEPEIRPETVLSPKVTSAPSVSLSNKRPKKIDYESCSKANAVTGSKGEAIVVKYERSRLSRIGRDDLAKQVK